MEWERLLALSSFSLIINLMLSGKYVMLYNRLPLPYPTMNQV